jgi:iron complex transport system ATP-binding protein
VAALLRQLSREQDVTMVMATHDLNLAASMCDTLALLRDGRRLGHGPTDEVLTAAMVRQLYDVEADVQRHDRAGHLTVTPVRRAG